MKKQLWLFTLFAVFMLSVFPYSEPAQAATLYKGTFEGFTYEEVVVDKKTTEYVISGVEVRSETGKLNSFRINASTYYFINDTKTTIDAFKYGMDVELSVSLRTIKEMRGVSDIEQGTIPTKSKEIYGTVTNIDRNGMYVRVKTDTGKEQNYNVNSETAYFKGKSAVDLSTLYEGDRVKMLFSATDTNTVEEMDITQTGALIENLYKGQLRAVNTTANRFTVVNKQEFADWEFGTSSNKKLTTFTFNASTSIYVGNKKITKNQLKNYRNSDLYYVTVKQFGKEIVKKIVVLQRNERTYFDELTLVNANSKYIRLKEAGTMYYHNGSILVRNGRLIESTSLAATGSAFVLTDGATKSTNTHIINVMNDGFLSSNLASHNLYFGRIGKVDPKKYTMSITSFSQFEQNGQYRNRWKLADADELQLSYSNNTVATQVVGVSGTSLVPSMSMTEGKLALFYVKDGHVQTFHVLANDETEPTSIFTGVISDLSVQSGTTGAKGIDAKGEMVLKNATQWSDAGAWLENASMPDLVLNQLVVVKNGKRVSVEDLELDDRVVVFANENMTIRIVLVNE